MLTPRSRRRSLSWLVLAAGLSSGASLAAKSPAAAPAPAPEALRPDRVVVIGADASDPSLRECASRLYTDASTHIVVFKDGVCVLDRGVRSLSSKDVVAGRSILEETGLLETAWPAPDGRGALLATVSYTDRVRVGGEEDRDKEPAADEGLRVATTLTWIDPSYPEGRFEVPLEPGRVVRNAVALPLGFGAAVLTQMQEGLVADFRIYDLLGKVVLRIPESEGAASSIASTTQGDFVLVDLALPPKPAGPDRALRIFDLLQGKSWDYTWTYGSAEEPLSWVLEDSGVLEVRLPGATRRFDRNGHPVGGKGSVKDSRRSTGIFNRLRD